MPANLTGRDPGGDANPRQWPFAGAINVEALDPVYDACSTLSEVENAIHELAGGDTHDPRYPLLTDETRVDDLRVAIYALQAHLVERHCSSVPGDLADFTPDELRTALGR